MCVEYHLVLHEMVVSCSIEIKHPTANGTQSHLKEYGRITFLVVDIHGLLQVEAFEKVTLLMPWVLGLLFFDEHTHT